MLEIASMARELEAMARAGGGTLDLTTGQAATLESGYYVGGAESIAAVVVPVEGPTEWEAILEAIRGQLAGGFVGVWEHEGSYYVDATDWHATEWEALEAGRARGEIAVWDIAKSVELTC